MKKTWTLLVLFTSITGSLCAQTNNKEDKIFDVPSDIIMNRRFYINLDKGNSLKIELTDITDLQKIDNIDSLLRIFMNDVTPLRDSFSDPITTKRLDYVTDTVGRKKIRFQQFRPGGASFLVEKGELASLKTGQDTINIIGIISDPAKPKQKISRTHARYYHLTFYLNNMSEIADYMNGILAQKIATIHNEVNAKWPLILGSGSHYLQMDRSITAERPRGFTPGGEGDYLEGFISVNVQNYKNYFVPSFSVGANITYTNRDRTYKWEPGLFWEPHFLFAKDAQGNLHTYRNDFLTLTYGQGGITDHDSHKDFSFSTVFSLGYLIHREGDLMEKNTFRLGGGALKLSKTTIEPSMYFNNFFKGVTPGIRISQRF
ncbi:MAG: hypothetical protein ABI359_08245 [Ginsengibacter sp.]